MLEGLVAANPDKLELIADKRIILRKERKESSGSYKRIRE